MRIEWSANKKARLKMEFIQANRHYIVCFCIGFLLGRALIYLYPNAQFFLLGLALGFVIGQLIWILILYKLGLLKW